MPLAMDEGRDLEQAAKLGRGTLPAGIASMNRSIVTIEPALAGWVVSFEGQALQVLPSKLEAIGFASRRAAEQHRTSGAPCGVSVRLRTGAYPDTGKIGRSEEHTSELQSLMRNSYAVFCL